MKPAEIALQQTFSEPVAQRSRCSSRQRRRKAKKLFVVLGFRPLDRGTAGVRGVRKRHDFMFLFESQSSRQRSTQPISQHLEFSPISGHLRSFARPELVVKSGRRDDGPLSSQTLLQRKSTLWLEQLRKGRSFNASKRLMNLALNDVASAI